MTIHLFIQVTCLDSTGEELARELGGYAPEQDVPAYYPAV